MAPMQDTVSSRLDPLHGYPPALVDSVRQMIDEGSLGQRLRQKYPHAHAVRTDGALVAYVQAIKEERMRSAGPLSKVQYDNRLQIGKVLGTHTRVSRVQGARLMAKREIRIAALFRDAPEDFLRMIVVHELAHLRESEHGKAFYQLCTHLEPDYVQLEFDVRIYLCHLQSGGEPLWRRANEP